MSREGYWYPSDDKISKRLIIPQPESFYCSSQLRKEQIRMSDKCTACGLTATEQKSLDEAKKFRAECDFLLCSIKKFNPSIETIETWFKKYNIYSNSIKWTDKQKVDNLVFFLDSSLMRVINQRKLVQLEDIKSFLSTFVDELISPCSNTSVIEHCKKMVKIFDQYHFSTYDIKFWLTCYLPLGKLRTLLNEVKICNQDDCKEKNFLNLILK